MVTSDGHHLGTPMPSRGPSTPSDRGSQYVSEVYRKLLADHGLVGRWAGAATLRQCEAESFMKTLKGGGVHHGPPLGPGDRPHPRAVREGLRQAGQERGRRRGGDLRGGRPPSMRFVPVKTVEQQAGLVLRRAGALLIRQPTMLIKALRCHLAEFGCISCLIGPPVCTTRRPQDPATSKC